MFFRIGFILAFIVIICSFIFLYFTILFGSKTEIVFSRVFSIFITKHLKFIGYLTSAAPLKICKERNGERVSKIYTIFN